MLRAITRGKLPLWLKLLYTLFVLVLVPVYWREYGPGNFLWFSDIALLTTVVSLWLESSLLTSTMALASVLLDFVWNVDFFITLIFGRSVITLAAYMFDQSIPLPIRLLSLFHVVLPVLILWTLYVLGYDRRAFVAQTLLAWIVLPLCYLLIGPAKNINWVYGFGSKPQTWMPPVLFLILLMILFPVVVYLPTHLLLKKIFSKAGS
jgi:hypothetical protein